MSTTDISLSELKSNSPAKDHENQNLKRIFRAAKPARVQSDFYGGVGWIIGLLLTLFVSVPVIWYFVNNSPRSRVDEVLLYGFAAAWWLNPLSIGALGYILSNTRIWRWWVIAGIFVWL